MSRSPACPGAEPWSGPRAARVSSGVARTGRRVRHGRRALPPRGREQEREPHPQARPPAARSDQSYLDAGETDAEETAGSPKGRDGGYRVEVEHRSHQRQ